MEIKIIPFKLFLIATSFAVIFLVFSYIQQGKSDQLYLVVCNDNGKLEAYIHSRSTDILIRPTSLKNITQCLGRYMSFYDRTIDYIINPSTSVSEELNKKYQVKKVLYNNQIKLGNNIITVSSSKISIKNINNHIDIYRAPLLSPFQLSENINANVIVIRPASEMSVEKLLSKSLFDNHILLKGENILFNLSRQEFN